MFELALEVTPKNSNVNDSKALKKTINKDIVNTVKKLGVSEFRVP